MSEPKNEDPPASSPEDLQSKPPDNSARREPPARAAPTGRYLAGLSLAALGVVYGDIGTSPLYALRESFLSEHGVAPNTANVLGVLSLIFWSLVIIISLKYLAFVLRADNRGEGGILSLTSLITPIGSRAERRHGLIILGLFAAACLYGDGMITPAISVLSAIEGLEVATPLFEPYVVPITIVIIIAIFSVQRAGTAGVAKVFGPVTLLWFVTLAALGVPQIIREPGVLAAVFPTHAVEFFLLNGWQGFVVLGSVFLVVTGGEALYADMGHFGARPIRLAWFTVVLPALLLNYFGQGALILREPAAIANPLFSMVSSPWTLYPLVLIATAAAVIASQAVISGSFSLTMQAVHLGYIPRFEIDHTSPNERGQIYVPAINWLLMLCCIGLVLGFRTSSNMAGAYGVAVTTTMVGTSILLLVMAREKWKWGLPLTLLVCGTFLVADLAFWSSNMLKVVDGGWFPLLAALLVFTLFTTWKKGRKLLKDRILKGVLPLDMFIDSIREHPPIRVPGTAVYMFQDPVSTPPALLHNLKHNKVLHDHVVFLSVHSEEMPYVQQEGRSTYTHLAPGLHQVVLHFGFMEQVDVPRALEPIHSNGLRFKHMETTYFLDRQTLVPGRRRRGMTMWRKGLFALMWRNGRSASAYFRLPPNRVVEMGTQVEL